LQRDISTSGGNGLLFGVGPTGTFAGTLTGYEFGVAIWYNGGSSYTLYWANSAGGSGGYNGTFSLTEVTATPLPAALPLFAPPALAQWACSAGAGSARTLLLSQSPDQNI